MLLSLSIQTDDLGGNDPVSHMTHCRHHEVHSLTCRQNTDSFQLILSGPGWEGQEGSCKWKGDELQTGRGVYGRYFGLGVWEGGRFSRMG